MSRAAFLLCFTCLAIPAQDLFAQSRTSPKSSKPDTTLALPVPWESIPAVTRDALSKVMKSPTLTTVSTADEFIAHTDMYQWLLDHPDRTSQAWKKLGVAAVDITQLKDGRFYWKDENGSEMIWQSVAQNDHGRVWYAEGRIKPGALVPTVPVTAVAILRHTAKAREAGDNLIKHQVEIFLNTDNRAANMVTRMMGDNAPRMAQQGSEQLLLFFSGIAKYTHDKPDKTKTLFAETNSTRPSVASR
jgi:hypothetical protein